MAEWLARPSAKQEVVQIPPQLKTRMWGKRPAAMLAIYTGSEKESYVFAVNRVHFRYFRLIGLISVKF